MNTNQDRRPRLLAGLALGVCTLAPACLDEPATHTPRAGLWSYTEQDITSNTCDDMFIPDPITQFILDYDEGDEFQIELGEDDAVCEIDGTEFFCAKYELGRDMAVDIDAVFVSSVRWEGTFASPTEAAGTETFEIECIGEDCAMIEALPCTKEAAFVMESVG